MVFKIGKLSDQWTIWAGNRPPGVNAGAKPASTIEIESQSVKFIYKSRLRHRKYITISL